MLQQIERSEAWFEMGRRKQQNAHRPWRKVLVFAVLAYVLIGIGDLAFSNDHGQRRYHFTAHTADGRLLLDELGYPLRFDSREAADDYAAHYEEEPR